MTKLFTFFWSVDRIIIMFILYNLMFCFVSGCWAGGALGQDRAAGGGQETQRGGGSDVAEQGEIFNSRSAQIKRLPWGGTHGICHHQAQEAQDDLVRTKEELHMAMTVPPPPPPPPPMYDHMDDSSDSEENNNTHSADLLVEGFNDHRNEEERLTEAEKNERVQKQLKVRNLKSEASFISQICEIAAQTGPNLSPCPAPESNRFLFLRHTFVLHSNAACLLLLSGPDLRAGSGTWRIQEHPERPPPLGEHAGRPRQIQDAATDPTGQHQAEDRRVRSLIGGLGRFAAVPLSERSLYASLPLCWRGQRHVNTHTHRHTRWWLHLEHHRSTEMNSFCESVMQESGLTKLFLFYFFEANLVPNRLSSFFFLMIPFSVYFWSVQKKMTFCDPAEGVVTFYYGVM